MTLICLKENKVDKKSVVIMEIFHQQKTMGKLRAFMMIVLNPLTLFMPIIFKDSDLCVILQPTITTPL